MPPYNLTEQVGFILRQVSQLVAADAPTIKGVVDRLHRRGLGSAGPADETKARSSIEAVRYVNDAALAPLSEDERVVFMAVLRRLH